MVSNDNRYFGGKALAGVREWICRQFPSHTYYAEPFAGKGSVFRRKLPALKSWLIDSDPDVVEWWDRQLTRNGSQKPRHVSVLHGDGIRFLELAAEWKIPDLLIYADPPYLWETRGRTRYRHDLPFAAHERILKAMLKLNGPAFISGYSSPLYEYALKRWTRTTREVVTRGGTKAIECLWCNPIAAASARQLSLEYWELGTDYRERERVDRKAKRWQAKYEQLDQSERLAILFALLDQEQRLRKGRP